MPVTTETPHERKTANKQKPVFSLQWCVVILCALISCSFAIFINYRLFYTASDIPPVASEQIQPSQSVTSPANATKPNSKGKLATTPTIWPIKGLITSGFGWRKSPLGDGNEFHPGIDIASTIGTPVVATADGQIVQSGWSGGYGNMVEIDHGNGITSIYGHNSQLVVTVGQTVKKGQVISYVGSTGESTGPHVHYEVRENGTAVDPWKYLVLN